VLLGPKIQKLLNYIVNFVWMSDVDSSEHSLMWFLWSDYLLSCENQPLCVPAEILMSQKTVEYATIKVYIHAVNPQEYNSSIHHIFPTILNYIICILS